MHRGVSALETAVLISIVVAAAAMLGSVLLRPQKLTTASPSVIIYTSMMLDKSPSSYVQQVATALKYDKIIDDSKPIVVGNSSEPYAVLMIVYVTSPGWIDGVKVTSIESGQVLTAYQYKAYLPPGRHVIFVFLNRAYQNVKVELVGATNTCMRCIVK